MGYKNDQFFHYGDSAQVSGKKISGLDLNASNPSFDDDPRNIVRFMEKNSNGEWAPQQAKLRRGYIRSLLTTVQMSDTTYTDDIPIVKCNFQFNPQYINHRVPMRTGLTNMFLQNAAQFSQPIAGDVTFAFELTFDRSYLLNNQDSADTGDQGSASEKNIGVLADLRSLYEVIGQGVSSQMVDFQRARAVQQAQREFTAEYGNATTSTTVDADGKESTTTTTTSSTNLTVDQIPGLPGVSNVFDPNTNKGNNSFLIPMPVRVVFSSLFMVDGYVTETDVTYTKFTTSLVPVQCRVGISMQALYVGFARERTFLTANLDDAAKAVKDTTQKTVEDAYKSNDTINKSLTKIVVQPLTDIVTIRQKKYTTTEDPATRQSETLTDISQMLVLNTHMQEYLRYRDNIIYPDYYASVGTTRYLKIDVQNDEGDVIKGLFESGSPPTIGLELKIRTYGPFDTSTKASEVVTSLESVVLNPSALVPPSSITSEISSLLISEETLVTPKITTADGWDNIRKNKKIPATLQFISAPNGYSPADFETNKNKYFVVSCSLTATVTTSQITRVPIQFKPSAYSTYINDAFEYKFTLTSI